MVLLLLYSSLFLLVFAIYKGRQAGIRDAQQSVTKHGHRCYAEGLNDSEREIVDLLSLGLSHKDYFIFNNLIIPSTNSGSVEIDHVVVSRFGIFIIETKDYKAWIYANKTQEKWTATYRNGEKHHFQNPMWQNYGHVMTLRKLMPFVDRSLIDVVVFTGQCEFKTARIKNVIYAHELIQWIQEHNHPIVGEQNLLLTLGKLAYLCQTADITQQEHIENIKSLLDNKAAKNN